jgi:YHS domain-containing protein
MPKARLFLSVAIAAMLVFGAWPSLAAETVGGEFGGECVMGLALGKDIKTDCSVNTVYKDKTYCFGNETAKTLFLKRPDDFLLQAHIYYSSKQEAEKQE